MRKLFALLGIVIVTPGRIAIANCVELIRFHYQLISNTAPAP